jgi:hypothetical protein
MNGWNRPEGESRSSVAGSDKKKVRASRTFLRKGELVRAAQPPANVVRKTDILDSPVCHCAGRREWIRTTDPHHVKVVL